VIEVDGNQHYTEQGLGYDRERDAYLHSLNLTVLRISNHDIDTRFHDVCKQIDACLPPLV